MKTTYAPGDRVALSARFLRSIGAVTGDGAFARGTVEAVNPGRSGLSMVEVKWDDDAWPVPSILGCNLTLVSRIPQEAAMAG